jgi:hypothetical protein
MIAEVFTTEDFIITIKKAIPGDIIIFNEYRGKNVTKLRIKKL